MSKHKRKVLCIELNQVFDSIQDASLELDLHIKCIWRCCNNMQKKTGGYSFIYEENKNGGVKNDKNETNKQTSIRNV